MTEVELKDVSLIGIDGFIERQVAMDQKSMARELERAFFSAAATAGSLVELTGITDACEKVEKLIQSVETVKNDYVDGVERDMIAVVCTPAMYAAMRTYFDKVQGGDAAAASFGTYHGVRVYSSTYLPAGTNIIAMAEGAVAQPVLPTIVPAERIQLSNAIGFGIFYSYGTTAVMPDLIFKA